MKMLKLSLLLLFISSILYGEVVNSVLVTVGNVPITTMDFNSRKKYLIVLGRMEGKKITDEDVYVDLIDEKVLKIKAEEYGIQVHDREIEREMDRIRKSNNIPDIKTFEKAIMAQGMDIDEYKSSIKKQIIIQNLYGVAIKPTEITDKEADAYYIKSKGDERRYFESDTSVQVAWIFFKAKTFSEKKDKSELSTSVRKMAINNSDFASLARKYSNDSRTKDNGGNLGYYLISDVSTKRLPLHLSRALNMVNSGYKRGSVSKVGETVGQGFWIVKILDVKKNEDAIRSRVKNYLGEQNIEKSFETWIDDESKKISIKRFEKIKSKI